MSDTPIEPAPVSEPPPAAPKDRARDFVFKVLLSSGGRMSDYYWNGIDLRVGDHCVVEEDGRAEFGSISLAKRPYLATCAKKAPVGRILRKATESDHELFQKLGRKEKSALAFCKDKAADLGLKMNVSSVHYSFDEKKAVFYFTAESRIDFRELVKDLNNFARIKVELRQIGVRDEAKILGGCGPCGEELCCSGFLSDFAPVSIKMAKNQFLALSPEKISGVCGRLLCCLSYENDVYLELQKRSPKMGKMVRTPDGRQGKVCQLNLLLDKISVSFEDGARVEYDISQFGIGAGPDQQPAPLSSSPGREISGPRREGPDTRRESPAPRREGPDARREGPAPRRESSGAWAPKEIERERVSAPQPAGQQTKAKSLGEPLPPPPRREARPPMESQEPKEAQPADGKTSESPPRDSEGWRRRNRGRRGRRPRE